MAFFRITLLVAFACSMAFASMDTLSVALAGAGSDVGLWWPVEKKNAPVLVWFHGGMSSGNCSKGLVAGDDLSKLYPEAVVVSASACRNLHWASGPMMGLVDAALDSVAARLKRPVEQVSLVGVSDGAIGVFSYSANGRRRVQDRLLVSSNGTLLGQPQELAAFAKFKEGRWRFLQGGSDRLYPSGLTVPWIDSFCKSVKVDCDLRFDPAGEHDWSYWKNNRIQWIFDAVPQKTKGK